MPRSAAFPAAVHHLVGKRQLRSVISSLPWQLAFSPLCMPGAARHSWWAAWGQGPHATHLTPQPPPGRVGAPGAGAVGSVPLSLPLVGVPGPLIPWARAAWRAGLCGYHPRHPIPELWVGRAGGCSTAPTKTTQVSGKEKDWSDQPRGR